MLANQAFLQSLYPNAFSRGGIGGSESPEGKSERQKLDSAIRLDGRCNSDSRIIDVQWLIAKPNTLSARVSFGDTQYNSRIIFIFNFDFLNS
jgi:hypothetical protein